MRGSNANRPPIHFPDPKFKMKSTTYQARRDLNGEKVSAGSITADSLDAAAERLTREHDIVVSPVGRPVFMDRRGRSVSIYLRVDPAETDKGREAVREHHRQLEIKRETEAREEAEFQNLLDEAILVHGPKAVLDAIARIDLPAQKKE